MSSTLLIFDHWRDAIDYLLDSSARFEKMAAKDDCIGPPGRALCLAEENLDMAVRVEKAKNGSLSMRKEARDTLHNKHGIAVRCWSGAE